MLIALTGTPGTGKTSLLQSILEAARFTTCSFSGVDLNAFIREHDLITGEDPERDSHNVDIGRMRELVHEKLGQKTDEDDSKARTPRPNLVLVEGHLAHHLDPELCLLLRCSPRVLRERLEKRGYSKEKVRENLEAEAMNIIRDEFLELRGGYESYHEQFLSVYKHPDGSQTQGTSKDSYLPHPRYHGLSLSPGIMATLHLVEIDTTHSSLDELTVVVAALLGMRLRAQEEIKNLKTEKGTAISDTKRKRKAGRIGCHVTLRKGFLEGLENDSPGASPPGPTASSSPEHPLEKHLLRDYSVGVIDWSSEILTWY